MKTSMSKIRKIEDEYELEQLNPVYTDNGKITKKKVHEVVDGLPEPEAAKMRIALMEAVIDEVIEDELEEVKDDLQPGQIEEVVVPLVEKAIELALLPVGHRAKVSGMIAKHLRKHDPRYRLTLKAANFLADAIAEVPDVKVSIDDDVIDGSIETTVNVEAEEISPEKDVEVNVELPTELKKIVKYQVASNINNRKATAMMASRFSSVMLDKTLYDLRYQLPDKFKKKYCK